MHVMPEVKVAVGNAKVEDAKKENSDHGAGHGDHKKRYNDSPYGW